MKLFTIFLLLVSLLLGCSDNSQSSTADKETETKTQKEETNQSEPSDESLEIKVSPPTNGLNKEKLKGAEFRGVFNGKSWKHRSGIAKYFGPFEHTDLYRVTLYPYSWTDCNSEPDAEQLNAEPYVQFMVPSSGISNEFVVFNITHKGRAEGALNVWNPECQVFIEETSSDSMLIYAKYFEGDKFSVEGYFAVPLCP